MASTLFFDHIAFKRLNSLFVAFNYLIVYSNIVTWLEGGKILLACQLVVYICNGVHDADFKGGQRYGRKVENPNKSGLEPLAIAF